MDSVKCDRCGAECVPSGCSTGYGRTADGKRRCFKCCADTDRESMIRTGRADLYLTHPATDPEVTNWPGSLKLRVIECRRIRHNWVREAWYVRFAGPDGKVWSGRNIGDNQILRARRMS